ncbi:MAG: nucleotidyltransferase family protein [Acidobacteriota bacterium]|nr:nucleotidyltransferase family protein [Acidobacteriota bacterium]
MNRALAHCIVRSLRVTGPREEPLAQLGKFSRPDWERTLSWLDDSGLALYLLERVDRAGADNALPQPIRARLQENLASNRQRVAQMKREFEFFNSRFEAAGVEFVVLKGFALVPDFCPDAVLRPQYDYDYLVHPECEEAARQVLQAAGYVQKNQSPGLEPTGETRFVSQPLSFPSANEDYYAATLPRGVELHLGLWEPSCDGMRLVVPGDILDRRRQAESQDMRFPMLADDDALLFQILHAYHHMLSYWCRPSCFLEIAHFMAAPTTGASFWEGFCRRISHYKQLPEISSLVFAMAAKLFEAPVPDQVVSRMRGLHSPALSAWVKRYGEPWALTPFPGSKLTLFILHEFIDDSAGWDKIRRNQLLPFHRPARASESRDGTPGSKQEARRNQRRFVLGRVKFHFRALLSYAWHAPQWNRVKRGIRGLA